MKLVITGVTGFLGTALARTFSKQGHVVLGTSRSEKASPGFPPEIQLTRLALGDPPPARYFEGVESVIHCAHDFSGGAFDRNVEGTKMVFEAARSKGVPHQTFVSSYSASAKSRTEYGRIKYAIENFFVRNGGTVIAPGLVLGEGGLGGRLVATMTKALILPVPAGVRFPYVGVEDFVNAVPQILSEGAGSIHGLYYGDFASFPELAQSVKAITGRPLLTIAVPLRLTTFFLAGLEFLSNQMGFPLRFRNDNFKSLQDNQSQERRPSEIFLRRPRMTLEKIISNVLLGEGQSTPL